MIEVGGNYACPHLIKNYTLCIEHFLKCSLLSFRTSLSSTLSKNIFSLKSAVNNLLVLKIQAVLELSTLACDLHQGIEFA